MKTVENTKTFFRRNYTFTRTLLSLRKFWNVEAIQKGGLQSAFYTDRYRNYQLIVYFILFCYFPCFFVFLFFSVQKGGSTFCLHPSISLNVLRCYCKKDIDGSVVSSLL